MRIHRRVSLATLMVAFALLFTQPSIAAFIAVDNFESFTGSGAGGALASGDGGWSFLLSGGTDTTDWRIAGDPAGGANKVLQLGGEFDRTLAKTIPGGSNIAAGATGTLFFRFRLADFTTGNGPSVGVGLADSVVTGQPGNAASWVNVNAVTGGGSAGSAPNTNTITAITTTGGAAGGGTQNTVSSVLAVSTWYSMWLVTNHTADTYEVYIQGGTAYPSQTLLSFGAQTTMQFRQTPIGTLDRVFLRPNNANAPATDIEFFDDIYADTSGVNLANPVPEPSGCILILFGSAASIVAAKRRYSHCRAD